MLETSTDASYGPMYTFDIGGTALSDAEDLEFYILIFSASATLQNADINYGVMRYTEMEADGSGMLAVERTVFSKQPAYARCRTGADGLFTGEGR